MSILEPDRERIWEDYPPTQALLLEVLAARWRLGYHAWPFSARHRPAAEALAKAGLVEYDRGFEPRTISVRFTRRGRQEMLLPTYRPPVVTLIESGLHLCVNGERAPGGNETWGEWAARAELFLRRNAERGP